MTLSSSAFAEGAPIPVRFTCDGGDLSPPLSWSAPPGGTAELAIIVDDPDAPGGTFTHWVMFGIDPGIRGLDDAEVPTGAKQALNGFGEARWRGPCPPPGDEPHRYFFTLLALSAPTPLGDGAGDQEVRDAIQPGVIASGQLMGTFGR